MVSRSTYIQRTFSGEKVRMTSEAGEILSSFIFSTSIRDFKTISPVWTEISADPVALSSVMLVTVPLSIFIPRIGSDSVGRSEILKDL